MTAKIIGRSIAILIVYSPLFLMILFRLRTTGIVYVAIVTVLSIIMSIRQIVAEQQVEDDITIRQGVPYVE